MFDIGDRDLPLLTAGNQCSRKRVQHLKTRSSAIAVTADRTECKSTIG